MATPVGDVLLASIRQRAQALIRYLDSLPLIHGAGAATYTAARDQIKNVVAQIGPKAAYRLSRSLGDDRIATTELRPILAYLGEVTATVDQVFARTGDVPRSLIRSVQRELHELGLAEVRPLLAVGGPANYESDDLWQMLLSEVTAFAETIEPPDTGIRVFGVPRPEGFRALWTPIAVGHEVGHLAVSLRGVVASLKTDSWLTEDDIDVETRKASQKRWPSTMADVLRGARDKLREWTEEVLCDLYAVRRFGPAAAAAQCELLAAIIAGDGDEEPLGTHPPFAFRAQTMLAAMPDLPEALDAVVAPWRAWLNTVPASEYEPLVGVLLTAIEDHVPAMVVALDALPTDRYDPAARAALVLDAAAWIRLGLPGPQDVDDPSLAAADLLNAGWLARLADTDDDLGDDPGVRLETIDALVAKGLDIADFLRLWHMPDTDAENPKTPLVGDSTAGGTSSDPADVIGAEGAQDTEDTAAVGPGERSAGPHNPDQPSPANTNDLPPTGPAAATSDDAAGGPPSAHHGAVISEPELQRRLHLATSATPVSAHDQSLIVTPRHPTKVAGASLDVRLGRGFISFRRSSTAAFEATRADQRPREMQEYVEKDWGGEFVLHPGELVLASTLEYLRLPADLTAQVITRSSYGRLGLLSATAIQVQPQFTGCLTLELINLGQMPLTLIPGERVAQLVFTVVAPPVAAMTAKYRFPTGPEFSRVREDPDLDRLRRMKLVLESTDNHA